ncbi:MAG: alanine dehydrogenase [Desulfobacterales bacterium]|nr:alanine dehydrogenase [Desulfobacterales bacterium]
MIIGVPAEIKDNEYRVSLTPGGVKMLAHHGHQVLLESAAGQGSGFSDEEYRHSGAEIISGAHDVWGRAELVVKVKEPVFSEYAYLRDGLMLFTFLHLAADEKLTRQLLDKGVTGIAYETVALDNGHLPLLMPMSEVAGRMAIQVGAHYLEKMNGGRGKLLGGVPGVRPCDVVIIGGGSVGTNAAQMALGLNAHVIIIDRDLDRLRYLTEILKGNLTTLSSNPLNISLSVQRADLLIGAVLIPGARAPRLVTREMIRTMHPGSVVVDVAIDQGGCIESVRPTTHSDPVILVDHVIHYGVTNMPGAVPRTSTYALSNATLPYILLLADKDFKEAARLNPALARGVNTYQGRMVHKAVAESFNLPHHCLSDLLP